MKEKQLLVVKMALGVICALFGLLAIFFTLDNRIIGLTIGGILAAGIIYRSYTSTIRKIQQPNAEIIFKGFELKSSMIYIVSWALLTYLFYVDNKGYHYLFYGLSFLTSALDDGLRFIIFDFQKKVVIGLSDYKEQQMDQMQIDFLENNNVRITDKKGFLELKKVNFGENNWSSLIKHLERIRTA